METSLLLMHQKFALGTTLFGWTLSESKSFELLDYFYFDLGQKVIDTADSYPQWKSGSVGGETEIILGNWINSRKIDRQDVFISTKIGRKKDAIGYSSENITSAVRGCLDRIKTDYLDLLYIHSSENFTKPDEVAHSLGLFINTGQIRSIGVSNFNLEMARGFSENLKSNSGSGLFALQNHYNLVERDSKLMPFDEYSKSTNLGMSSEIIPWMKQDSIYNICYHALCRGVLTDFTARHMRIKETSLHLERTTKYLVDPVLKLLTSLNEISKEIDINVSSIALQWLRQEYGRTLPVISCNSIKQLQDASFDFVLSEKHFEMLDILRLA